MNLNFTITHPINSPTKASRPLDKTVDYQWRQAFFDGFHKSIPAFASAGIDLKTLLAPFDVFWIGVHAPIAEIERRERSRGDRQLSGERLSHYNRGSG